MAFPRKSTGADNKHDGERTSSVRSYRSGREQTDYMAAEKRTASSDQTLSILQQSNAIAAEK